MTLNIGMVGCGKWGKKVADEIEKHKDFKLKSIVCSQKNDQLENISNISTYKNFKKTFIQSFSYKLQCLLDIFPGAEL